MKNYRQIVKQIFVINLLILFVSIYSTGSIYGQCTGCPAEEKCAPEASSGNTDTAAEDEFSDFDKEDEFSDYSEDDEFEEFSENEESAGSDEFEEFRGTMASDNQNESAVIGQSHHKLRWVLGILFVTIITGFMVRHRQTRQLRMLILLASLIVLGFYRGGCPCMISSFQDLILSGMGQDVHWVNLVWFLGLIPITYIFGQVWCGWVCHLGAFQEFLYRKNRFKFLQGEKAQKVMKIIRILLVAGLIIQIIATQTNWFIKIDPFKVAFNLTSYYTVGWVLLGLLLLSSLFINRPFCRAACPVGLFLGLVSKIPGAAIIAVNKSECVGCKTCSDTCDTGAILRKGKMSVLKNTDCILCGECMDDCKKSGLSIQRKSKKNNDVVILEKCKEIPKISIAELKKDLENIKN